MPETSKRDYALKGALVKCTGSQDPSTRITFLAKDIEFKIDDVPVGTVADTSPDDNFEFHAEEKKGFVCKYRKSKVCQPKLAPSWYEETETVKYGGNDEFNKLYEAFHEKYKKALASTIAYVESCDNDFNNIAEGENKKRWIFFASEYCKELKLKENVEKELKQQSVSKDELQILEFESKRKAQSFEEIQACLAKLTSLMQIYKTNAPSEALEEKRKEAENAVNEAISFIELVEKAKQNIKVNKAILLSSVLICTSGGGVLSFDKNAPITQPEDEFLQHWYKKAPVYNGPSDFDKIITKWVSNRDVLWDQSKITKTWNYCESIYDKYKFQVDPRFLLSIIQAEGTGSWNTNSEQLAGDGQHGIQSDFDKDLRAAVDIVMKKWLLYIPYNEEFKRAVQANNSGEYPFITGYGDMIQYMNWQVPKYFFNNDEKKYEIKSQVYAGAVRWADVVSSIYDDVESVELYDQVILKTENIDSITKNFLEYDTQDYNRTKWDFIVDYQELNHYYPRGDKRGYSIIAVEVK